MVRARKPYDGRDVALEIGKRYELEIELELEKLNQTSSEKQTPNTLNLPQLSFKHFEGAYSSGFGQYDNEYDSAGADHCSWCFAACSHYAGIANARRLELED